MRLLHVTSHLLEEFFEPNVPRYVILSHRWEDDEVLFSDIGREAYRNKKGYRKLQLVCKEAISMDINYVWIDTCCIDKSSSAELSESINSMFRWYRDSFECYVYLCDIQHATLQRDITQSVWFNRGWTLQELIAPKRVVFYDLHGSEIGDRRSLSLQISQKTQIHQALLSRAKDIEEVLLEFTAAQKMSWAAGRRTTRVEDRAYCLLGLFGVSMPLLYGEGTRSFLRLQEEILRTGTDLSILSWSLMDDEWISPRKDLLAESPDDFQGCETIVRSFPAPDSAAEGVSFAMTNKGLQIDRPPIVTVSESGNKDNFALSLGHRKVSDLCGVLALKIVASETTVPTEQPIQAMRRLCHVGWASDKVGHDIRLVRAAFYEPVFLPDWSSITISKKLTLPVVRVPSAFRNPQDHLWILLPETDPWSLWKVLNYWPLDSWDQQALACHLLNMRGGKFAAIVIGNELGESFVVRLEYTLRTQECEVNTLKFALTEYDSETFMGDATYSHNSTYSYGTKEDALDISPNCRVKALPCPLDRGGGTVHQLQIKIERKDAIPAESPYELDSSIATLRSHTIVIDQTSPEFA